MADTPCFLTPSDAARLAAMSAQNITRLADRGLLRLAGRTSRGGRLFAAEDIAALIERRRAGTPTDATGDPASSHAERVPKPQDIRASQSPICKG
jgi:hypothetical protein